MKNRPGAEGALANLSASAASEVAEKLELMARCEDLRHAEEVSVSLAEQIARLEPVLKELGWRLRIEDTRHR